MEFSRTNNAEFLKSTFFIKLENNFDKIFIVIKKNKN